MASGTVFILHNYPSEDGLALRLNMGDLWIDFPAGEPVEMESEFIANRFVDFYKHYGFIVCPMSRGRGGISIDADAACRMADVKREEVATQLLNQWVVTAKSIAGKGGVVVMPTGVVAEVLQRRHIDVKKAYGIAPVGLEEYASSMMAYSGGGSNGPSETEQRLRAENEQLRREMAEAQTGMDQRLLALEQLLTK